MQQPEDAAIVNDYIDLYEGQILSKALGESLKAALIAGLAVATPEDRWTKLKTGDSFTDTNGNLVVFTGLAPANVLKQGVIAPYVFFHFMRDNMTSFTGSNALRTKSENGDSVSPMQQMSRTYNTAVENIRILWAYLNEKADVYPEWNSSEADPYVAVKINAFGI